LTKESRPARANALSAHEVVSIRQSQPWVPLLLKDTTAFGFGSRVLRTARSHEPLGLGGRVVDVYRPDRSDCRLRGKNDTSTLRTPPAPPWLAGAPDPKSKGNGLAGAVMATCRVVGDQLGEMLQQVGATADDVLGKHVPVGQLPEGSVEPGSGGSHDRGGGSPTSLASVSLGGRPGPPRRPSKSSTVTYRRLQR